MNNRNAAVEIITKEGFTSPDFIIQDWALMTALSKIEKYKAECDLFQHKYQMSFQELDTLLHKKKDKEDFRKEEDFVDWEFAISALKWWERKALELKSA